MEHRARHSRARRHHAPEPAAAELTAADLRTLRELLRAEDRADTSVVPKAPSSPDARPRHAADRTPVADHLRPTPTGHRHRGTGDTGRANPAGPADRRRGDADPGGDRHGAAESAGRAGHRRDTGPASHHGNAAGPAGHRRGDAGHAGSAGPVGGPAGRRRGAAVGPDGVAGPVIGRRAARRRATERATGTGRRRRVGAGDGRDTDVPAADPAEADTEIITGDAARKVNRAAGGRGGGTVADRLRLAAVYGRRGLAAVASLAVLVGTGYGWASVSNLQKNLNTSDVIISVPHDMPTDGATDILLVGSDSRTDANGNPLPLEVLKLLRTEESAGLNTDTIILIRVPEDGGNAYAVSIPRDTYVPIPGYREDKINTAYGVSKRLAGEKLRAEGATDEPAIDRQAAVAGQRVLVQTVEALTGAKIDHYAEINLYGFYLLTEAVGGVEVCLKRSTKDSDSGADFRKGRQVVSGGDALAFVRQRKNLPRGDLDRIVRQQVFMAALANRMLGAGTLTDPGKLSGLMDAAQKSIVLDDGWDVLAFARQLQGVAAGNVEFVTIPVLEVGARNERGQSIITVDPAAVQAFVAGLLGGPPVPTEPTAGQTAPPAQAAPAAPAVDPSTFVVTARNGTSSSGLAGRVLDRLAANGFRVGQPDNGPLRDTSEIRVAPGARAVGERITAVLGPMPVVEDPTFAADRPRILLGADYTGPGAQALLAGPLLRLDGTARLAGKSPRLDGTARLAQPAPTPADDAPITAEGITCVN